ncbi:hypothetical protein LJ737_23715 [Hymenobacter sp. 15J16-1T3B]|uniref:hypothetical protein n=1 Tax=Hymenobacter sp. 15J16-1T3B TaxID=2886941 RepID=UPI001D12E781|nr:hypothetical protein [Hymenobacter sp. 15J16-1T3B]MCC3160265.1 hypothetical protein [Hymenobacter sp. 15J16-1T3B]
MKRRVTPLLAAASLLAACHSDPDTTRTAAVPAAHAPQAAPTELPAAVSVAAEAPTTETAAADTADQYETMYVVIADTSRQYRPLRRQLLRLQAATGQRIDTMGRFYDPQKDLIRLPDDDADELYAGDYFPRRLPDATLSVEYTNLYAPAHAKSMALVTGIYQEPERADSLLAVVRRAAPTAFRVKTRMYIGCMH